MSLLRPPLTKPLPMRWAFINTGVGVYFFGVLVLIDINPLGSLLLAAGVMVTLRIIDERMASYVREQLKLPPR